MPDGGLVLANFTFLIFDAAKKLLGRSLLQLSEAFSQTDGVKKLPGRSLLHLSEAFFQTDGVKKLVSIS